jgi:hypothetical protein
VGFIPDKIMDAVALGKTFNGMTPVLMYPLYLITGDTNIKRPIALAGKNINAGLFHNLRIIRGARKAKYWIPACAGMTNIHISSSSGPRSGNRGTRKE